MESFALGATGKSSDALPEIVRSARIGVRDYSRRDSIEEPEVVELIEERFGRGHCAPRLLCQLIEYRFRESIELDGREYAGHEADLLRFVGGEYPPCAYQIKCVLLANRATQHRHHHRGHETNRHLRVRESGFLVREHNVTGRSQSSTPGVSAAFHERDDRLLHATNGVKHVPQRLRIVQVLLPWRIQHFLEGGEIGAGTEVRTFPIYRYDVHRRFAEREQCLRQLVGRGSVERVLLLRASERDPSNRSVDCQSNVLHFAVGSPNRFASGSGTSMTIRSNAVENTFPCASVLRERVPPPASAPCSRKLSAFRFGSSKRSTSPSIMPRK